MANCEIKSLIDRSKTSDSDNLPREGLVNDVCREWLLHEDQALAYRLQTEEYQHHLGHNKERNAILRTDTPKAREEQLKEDEEAARIQTEFELSLARQEARDAALAAAIGEDLERQEKEKNRLQELKDIKLAKKLMDEEKEKVRQMREVKQVEREAAYLGINSGLDNVAILSRKDKRGSRSKSSNRDPSDEPVRRRGARSGVNDLSDLSDFCIKPSSSMDEEEMRRLQEEQDEELARLMQEQDLKRRGDLLQEAQLLAIEAQDKELAKVLQEQDLEGHAQNTSPSAFPEKNEYPDQMESSHYASVRINDCEPLRPNSPQYATPLLLPKTHNDSRPLGDLSNREPQRFKGPILRPNSLDLPHVAKPSSSHRNAERDLAYSDQQQATGWTSGNSRQPMSHFDSVEVLEALKRTPPRMNPAYSSRSPSKNATATPSGFTNIACAIDPTYQRRVRQGELSSPASVVSPVSPTSYQHSSPTNTSSTSSSSASGYPSYPNPNSSANISPLPPPIFDDEDEYLPPPYMPIQGQRRTASLEKRKGGAKLPKEKGGKSGCKQQ